MRPDNGFWLNNKLPDVDYQIIKYIQNFTFILLTREGTYSNINIYTGGYNHENIYRYQ